MLLFGPVPRTFFFALVWRLVPLIWFGFVRRAVFFFVWFDVRFFCSFFYLVCCAILFDSDPRLFFSMWHGALFFFLSDLAHIFFFWYGLAHFFFGFGFAYNIFTLVRFGVLFHLV